jgi:hypothetical protein
MPATEGSYAFKNVRAIQRERLRTLEALLDEGTIRHLEARGVERGWRCLEVGARGAARSRAGCVIGWVPRAP